MNIKERAKRCLKRAYFFADRGLVSDLLAEIERLGDELASLQHRTGGCEHVRLMQENEKLKEALAIEVGPEMWHLDQIRESRRKAAQETLQIINAQPWNCGISDFEEGILQEIRNHFGLNKEDTK